MPHKNEVSVFWFRRDLRIADNVGLWHALTSGLPVIPIFIFDDEILDGLPKNDARVTFIYSCLRDIHLQLKKNGSSLLIKKGNVDEVWKELISKFNIKKVFFNRDYEPYAIERDRNIVEKLSSKNIATSTFKDQVIFEKNDILKADGKPYTVYTPYKNKWLNLLESTNYKALGHQEDALKNFYKYEIIFPTLEAIGFVKSKQKVSPYNLTNITTYDSNRDYPGINGTSNQSPHLRFGTVSSRKLVALALTTNAVFLSELIWREFFMQILFHFPQVVTHNFKRKYDHIVWRDDASDFAKWCRGNTGYPLVDAGMRQLNETGYMHNRVRMVVAGFLCKHLLINWKFGEAYFAEKLLDYELSSNNGTWQWAAGTGCDAAPYFRIFNPSAQLKKYDGNFNYVSKWVPNFQELTYPNPIIPHKEARERCLNVYRKALLNK